MPARAVVRIDASQTNQQAPLLPADAREVRAKCPLASYAELDSGKVGIHNLFPY